MFENRGLTVLETRIAFCSLLLMVSVFGIKTRNVAQVFPYFLNRRGGGMIIESAL